MLLADYLNYLLSDEINIPKHKHYDFYKLLQNINMENVDRLEEAEPF